jgi:hypothetical protein
MSGIIHSKQAQANLMLITVCGLHRIGPGRVAQREAASMDVYAGLCNARPGCRGMIFEVSWIERGRNSIGDRRSIATYASFCGVSLMVHAGQRVAVSARMAFAPSCLSYAITYRSATLLNSRVPEKSSYFGPYSE